MEWEKEYLNHEKWGSRMWAWQFLIRHKDFVEECKHIKKLDADERMRKERDVARKYGLRKFYSYDKKIKNYLQPDIFFDSINYWTYDEWLQQDEGVSIEKEEVIVVFDLLKTLDDKEGINYQIKKLKKILEEHRESILSRQDSVQKFNAGRMWRKNYLRHLKIIDERSKGTTWVNIAKMIFPEGVKDGQDFLDDHEIMSKYYKMMKSSESKTKYYKSIIRDDFKSKWRKSD